MESYSVSAILSAIDKGFTTSMVDADNRLTGLDKSAGKAKTSILDIAKGIGAFKIIESGISLVKSSVDGAISRFDTLSNSDRVFENMGFSANVTKETMDALKKSIQGLPTPLDGAVKGVQLIASSTNDLGRSQKIFEALNNGILGFGGNTAQVDNAVIQLSQSFSNGKVDAETWNSMINSGLGPALNALAKTMGLTTGELKKKLSEGTVSVAQFQDSLIKLNEEGGGGLKSLKKIAQDAMAGIGTGVSNMRTAVVRGVANVIGKVDELTKSFTGKSIGENITEVSKVIDKAFIFITNSMNGAIPIIKNLKDSINFTLIGYIITDVTNILKTFFAVLVGGNAKGKAINAISATFNFLGAIVERALQNIALFFSALSSSKAPEILGVAFRNLKDILMIVLGSIKKLFDKLGTAKGQDKQFDSLISAITVVATIFERATQMTKDFINWLGSGSTTASVFKAVLIGVGTAIAGVMLYYKIWQTAINVVTKAQKAWSAVTKVASGVQAAFNLVMSMNPIALVVIAVLALVAGIVYLWKTNEGFRNAVIALWDGIKAAFIGTKDAIIAAWNGIGDWFKSVFDSIKNGISGAWNGTKQAAKDAVQGVKDAWNGVKGWFGDLWKGTTDGLSNAWSAVSATLAPYVEGIKNIFQPMLDFFSGLWDNVKVIFTSAWQVIKTIVMGPILLLIDLITGQFDQFKKDFSMLWKNLFINVGLLVSTFIQVVTGYFNAFWQVIINIFTLIGQTINSVVTVVVTTVQNIFNAFISWIVSTVNNMVTSVVSAWDAFKQGSVDAFNATIQFITSAFSAFIQWIVDSAIAIVNGIVQGWENLKQGTANAFTAMIDGVKAIWDGFKQLASDLIDGIVGVFDKLRDIDLLEIGRSIIDGFVKGLKGAWESGMKFISGIGDWIREHKGPIRKDKVLLTPAGMGIMGGLNKGLTDGFRDVKSNISGMGSIMSDALNGSYSMDIGANVAAANSAISSQISHDVNLNSGKQPAYISVRVGNQEFRRFVDDISSAQGQDIDSAKQF